jgi:hypothetical protein
MVILGIIRMVFVIIYCCLLIYSSIEFEVLESKNLIFKNPITLKRLKVFKMEDDEEHSIAIKMQNEHSDVGIDICIDNKEMENIISADGKSIILNIIAIVIAMETLNYPHSAYVFSQK